jgi:ectoine hydroxylase-related dioxygenase (phytanoyl-CoA dioxygenase family)
VWQDVAVHPWVLQVMERVLGEGFLLSSLSTIVIGPGEPAQAIHVDDAIYGFARPHPPLSCNSMWALTDFTDEIGATRVVPGSNNWPDDPTVEGVYETIPVEMPASSIAIIAGHTYHGGGANRTDRHRPAVAMNYCNGVIRQQENLMLAVHPARMMTFAPELQDIIGFKQCRLAGYIFGQQPRVEMERRYPTPDAADPYIERRDSYHHERITVEQGYV